MTAFIEVMVKGYARLIPTRRVSEVLGGDDGIATLVIDGVHYEMPETYEAFLTRLVAVTAGDTDAVRIGWRPEPVRPPEMVSMGEGDR